MQKNVEKMSKNYSPNFDTKKRSNSTVKYLVFQNKYITAFKDIDPNAPVHILIIPNKRITSLNEIHQEDSGYLSNILLGAKMIAKQMNIDQTGYRLITNCGRDGGQEVPYLHFHLVILLFLDKLLC